MRIDEPRRICDGKTPLERHAAARLHEAGKAVRDCDGEPRRNQDALMGWNIDGLIRAKVEPCITRIGIRGQLYRGVEPFDLYIH